MDKCLQWQHATYLSQLLFHLAGTLMIFVVWISQAYLLLENSDTLGHVS